MDKTIRRLSALALSLTVLLGLLPMNTLATGGRNDAQKAGEEGFDTSYDWDIVDFDAVDAILQDGTDSDEPTYVLMNIPYGDFYGLEVNSTAPNAADAADIDAWTSATKSKPLSGSLSAGSYHVNSDGSDISGVIYPVQVSDLSLLNGQTQVTDETAVSITTTTRGETSTTEYKGADALFQSANYSYYVLSEAPTVYKVLTENGGAFSFGPSNAPAQTVSGVTAALNYETHHNNDVEIALSGVELPEGAVVSGVIVTDSAGNQYPLRHMEGIWRQTQIGWPDTAAAGIGGRTITNVRFILRDRMLDCPVNFLVKPKLDAKINAVFTGAREITVSGLTDAVQNPTATVTYTTGERPNTETHTVAENVTVTSGRVTLTEDAIDGTAYTVKVVSGNYGDKSASVTYTASEAPEPKPGTDTPDPTPGTDTPEPGNNPSGQGCYVATAVYGSYDCPEVWTLRRYRDDVLGETWYGRLFIKLYYAASPTAVRLFGNTDLFQNFFRARLNRMVDRLQEDGFASTPYQDKDW